VSVDLNFLVLQSWLVVLSV
jgi:hypothetical protein